MYHATRRRLSLRQSKERARLAAIWRKCGEHTGLDLRWNFGGMYTRELRADARQARRVHNRATMRNPS
jgi:hypothetical protein